MMNDVICIKERYQDSILKKENVVGVGIGFKKMKGRRTDTLSVVVLVDKKLPLSALKEKDVVQKELDGVLTDVQEIGIVEALNTKVFQPRIDKWRPAPGGVSIGHYRGSSGTLGVAVTDRRLGERLILSNNHVLAYNGARIGDPVLQPGPFDGGKKQDEIAELYRFVPLSFMMDTPACGVASKAADVANVFFQMAGSQNRFIPVRVSNKENTVDAAVALPLMENSIKEEILDIGVLEGIKEAELGMTVEKSGRTTGHNRGQVDVADCTLMVNYNYQRTALFSHQIVVRLASKGGDSGSLIVSEKSAVGLLFAGSERFSVCNPMDRVANTLHIEI